MKKGDVISWKKYLHQGNESATDKLFVVVGCGRDGCWLMLKTTSIERTDRPDDHGCHHANLVFRFKKPLFGFDKPTWVQFEGWTIREEREVENAGAKAIFSLKDPEVRAIVNCFKNSEEISNWLAEYCN